MVSPQKREIRIQEEEAKLGLEVMVMSFQKKPLPYQTEELFHANRVIARMQERERWFEARILQLEAHAKKVRTVVQEEQPLRLNLGDLSLPHHERIAKNMRACVLQEDGLCEGATPVAPLLPIPTHSMKKEVSWHDITLMGKNDEECSCSD